MISPLASIHAQALVDNGATVGARTRVWAFTHLLPGAIVGDDCNICDHTFIEGGAKLGHRVTVKCGVYLWDGVRVEDDAFIGPCVAFTNDLRPRSKRYPEAFMKTHLRAGCSIGANATILPVTIGRYAMIAAGAIVTHDVPDFALMVGQPARLTGWVCRCGQKLNFIEEPNTQCECGKPYRLVTATSVEELPL